jgi:phosphoglucomutase
MLANIPRLVSAYYTGHPGVSEPEQQVSFGTSGHRGSSLADSFNEDHILAISAAICSYRKKQGTVWTLTRFLSRRSPPRSKCSQGRVWT